MLNTEKIIEKYYAKDSEICNILMQHSEQVKNKALEIAFRKPELDIDTEFVWEAAMLHDIGIFLCHAPRIYCFGTHHYIEHGYLGAELLRAEGLPRHALVCERHTGTGLSKEMLTANNLPVPHRDLLPVTPEEQLICYADKFFSKTKLGIEHDIEHIRQDLARYGELQVMIFDKWHNFFGA